MNLDWPVQFLRAAMIDDGFGQVESWALPGALHGETHMAHKRDLSDGERWRAGEVQAHVTTRFTVRYSPFTAAITPKDRLVCEGVTYEIAGRKEGPGRRQWIELTCAARTDTGE